MAKIKNFFKEFVPPIVLKVFNFTRRNGTKKEMSEIWSGDYVNWAEAEAKCTGYNSDHILEKCKNALIKVRNGQAVYERDGILFSEIQYSWGLLASLQKAALENDGKLYVLDFGGSLGSTYYQNREFLNTLKETQWFIVEQPHFVDCGKEYFEDDKLKFYYTIEECLLKRKPTVFLLSSVLQYLDNPYALLDMVLQLNIPYLVLDRLALTNEGRDILTIQNVSKDFYESKLGHWFFDYKKLTATIRNNYDLIASDYAYCEKSVLLNNETECFFKLLIFKHK